MAYTIKNSQEFEENINDYLEKYPIKLSYERSLLENYTSSDLSDLYKLFVDLKGKELSKELFDKLKNIIKGIYHLDDATILGEFNDEISTYTIKKENIDALADIIKNRFLEYISNPENNNIREEELYNLTVIVNKIYPSLFLTLIKNPTSNIEKDQKIIVDRILGTIEHWHKHNTQEAEDENRDILGALYTTVQKYYSDVDIYTPGRIKSGRSSIANINKVATNSLDSLIPSDLSTGLSTDDIDKQFSMQKANTDFSGFTIVVSNIDDTMHLDKRDFRSNEVIELRKIREESINFSHSLENFLTENEYTEFSNKELLQIKIELLMRLRLLTYEECTKEYEETSFTKLLSDSLKSYKNSENEVKYDEVDSMFKLDEIYQLLDELKKRVHDKYQAKMAEIIVPEILEDELLTDTLRLKVKFVKKVKKENGFCADYYELETAGGRKIELQVITRLRFKESKDGSSDHSKLPNKEIKISHFFEPVVKDYDRNNYERLLEILNTTPIAKRNSLYLTPDQELSSIDKRLKRKLKIAEQNIKLKETFSDEHIFPNKTVQKTTYGLDEYLINFAEFVSPKLMSVSSHHTRFNKGVAGYSKKSIISAFTEVLLKHDYTSCLAQMLIDRLEAIVPNDKHEISRNGIVKRANKRYMNIDEPKNSKEGIEH